MKYNHEYLRLIFFFPFQLSYQFNAVLKVTNFEFCTPIKNIQLLHNELLASLRTFFENRASQEDYILSLLNFSQLCGEHQHNSSSHFFLFNCYSQSQIHCDTPKLCLNFHYFNGQVVVNANMKLFVLSVQCK